MASRDFRHRAFLVEDSKIIRDSLVSSLDELADTHVVAFADSQGPAIDWLNTNAGRVDFVILDMFLLTGTGLAVLSAMRSQGLNTDAYVLTNYPSPELKLRFEQLGVKGFFDKSNQTEEFFETLRQRGSATLH